MNGSINFLSFKAFGLGLRSKNSISFSFADIRSIKSKYAEAFTNMQYYCFVNFLNL